MTSDRLKKVIYNKLNMDLSKVEIIPYKDGIWFIDRENKHWYFELKKSGLLFWRYSFFVDFFSFFSMDRKDFEPIIGQWVEDILNCEVSSTKNETTLADIVVEDILNCEVSSTLMLVHRPQQMVNEILNCKVSSTSEMYGEGIAEVEEVLNCR